MADSFKIKYQGQVTPLEVLDAAGSATSTIAHGNIGKTFTGSSEVEISADSARVHYKDYTTTTSRVSLEDSTILNGDLDIEFMFIKIREAAGTGTPDCQIDYNGGAGPYPLMKLIGVNDFLIFPRINSESDGGNFFLLSSGSTALAKVDIIIGEYE